MQLIKLIINKIKKIVKVPQTIQELWSRIYPVNAKESLLRIAGRQQRQGKVGAEDVPDGQMSQALGCHGAALSKGQTQ